MIKPLVDETLVYDLTAHRATCLNRQAASVWDLCDGTRDIAALAGDSGIADQAAVQQALQKLADAGLLTETLVKNDNDQVDTGRRAALGKMVAGIAMAAPIVTTMTVPTAAQASSCIATGASGCVADADCCDFSNTCNGGTCDPL